MKGPDRSHSSRAGARHQVAALARQEALDGLRGRRQLLVRAVTPILLFGVVLAATLVTRGPESVRTSPYRVAVENLDGGRATVDSLASDRLRFESSSDAALDTSRTADLGLILPDRLDERRAGGEQVRITMFEKSASAPSRSAAAIVRAAFGEQHRAEVVAAGPAGPAPHLTLELTNVQRTEAGTRVLSAELVPALLLLQAALLVSGTATRLLGRRNRGLLVSQLLLPMSRWRMAVSKMLAELATGLVAAAPVLLAVVAFVGATSYPRQGVAATLVDVCTTLLVAVALAVPMAAIGLLIGTASRSQEQVSLATAATIIAAAAMAALVVLGERPPPHPAALVPIAGLAGELRRVLAGDGSALWLSVGLGSTALLTVAVAHLASRRFNGERLVLRSAS